jgi:hypothetical protein
VLAKDVHDTNGPVVNKQENKQVSSYYMQKGLLRIKVVVSKLVKVLSAVQPLCSNNNAVHHSVTDNLSTMVGAIYLTRS